LTVALDDARSIGGAKAAPRAPKDDGEQSAERADQHQDPSDGYEVDASDGRRHGKRQYGSHCHQKQAYSDTHDAILSSRSLFAVAIPARVTVKAS
jgi:hypothetical protein